MTSTIQSLCISILETLLQVTLKRRAEISADSFARLLRYFFLSCKNLTIIIYCTVLSFEIRADIFLRVLKVFDEPLGESDIE